MANPPNDPAQLLASLLAGGQAMLRPFGAFGMPSAPESDKSDPMGDFIAATQKIGAMQQDFWKQALAYWSAVPGAAAGMAQIPNESAADSDRRFAAEAWRNDPRFDLIRRSYLAYSNFLQNSVESAQIDEKTKAQMRHGMRQFIDAMSPSNFLVTNPEALQLAAETGGKSLTEGMNLFFEDMAKGRVSSTDEKAYEVGKNIAITPGAVIFENDLIQVIQYKPTTDEVYQRALLLVPPAINKFYILDLQPENSFVRFALEQGHTVFLLSWRNVDARLGHLTWDDYLDQGVRQAIDVALDVTDENQVNTLGFCVGGTLLASMLAVMAAKNENKVSSMTLLTTMLDFTDTGEIGSLVTEQSVAAREAAIGNGGLMPGKELAFTFTSLRANDLMWQYVVNNYLKGKAPPAFDLLYWNADSTNLPGPMFCWYVRNMYLENNLRQPGKTVQCGEEVDLSLIDIPTFLYASREDHIVPWRTAYQSTQILAGDNTFVLGASGHIAGVINPPAKKKRNFWMAGAADPDPERWLETAQSVPGSWWPAWSEWLAQHAGDKVPARVKLGNRDYRKIEPAPGRYVKAQAE
jgi:polyhydroxyalkanoate synthase